MRIKTNVTAMCDGIEEAQYIRSTPIAAVKIKKYYFNELMHLIHAMHIPYKGHGVIFETY